MAECCGKQMYVTGGNDGCIVVWDVGETKNEPTAIESTKNGMMAGEWLVSIANPF